MITSSVFIKPIDEIDKALFKFFKEHENVEIVAMSQSTIDPSKDAFKTRPMLAITLIWKE